MSANKNKISTYDYDAKSERAFCESIPKGVSWDFQNNVYTWTYSELHCLGELKVGKDYEKKYTPDLNFKGFDLELKGYLRPDAKKRMEIFRKLYPDADVRIAFQKDLSVTKKAKRKYSDWAKLNNFKWCIAKTFQELPKEWQEELLKGSKEDGN